jgi:hypothetical protein
MRKILQSWRRLFRAAPRPDPLELIVEAFARDPFRGTKHPSKESRSGKAEIADKQGDPS